MVKWRCWETFSAGGSYSILQFIGQGPVVLSSGRMGVFLLVFFFFFMFWFCFSLSSLLPSSHHHPVIVSSYPAIILLILPSMSIHNGILSSCQHLLLCLIRLSTFSFILSHPSRRLICELNSIGRHPSSVHRCPSTFSNDFLWSHEADSYQISQHL